MRGSRNKYGLGLAALVAAGVTAVCAAAAPAPLETIATVDVGAQSGMVLFAAGSIWSTDLALGRVVRIDPATNTVARKTAFASRPFGIAYGAGSLWVADRSINTLGRIDPRTGKVLKK